MDYKTLLQEAKNASTNAYVPYSGFPVGACVVFESEKTYTGCNIENASYGLSLCAERNAMSNALSQGEKSKIKAIAIYSPKQKMCMPCGACRQWLFEFALSSRETEIILEGENSEPLILTLEDIFPYAFKFDDRQ